MFKKIHTIFSVLIMLKKIYIFFSCLISVLTTLIFLFFDIFLIVLLHYLNFYILACEIRIALFWFLNINPYVSPWDKLTNLVKPVTNFGSKIYPKIFGFNLGFFINLYILRKLFIYVELAYYYRYQFRNYRYVYKTRVFQMIFK